MAMGKRRNLHLWALLSLTLAVSAQAPPKTMQLPPAYPSLPAYPPSAPVDYCHSTLYQFISLCFFYFIFDGAYWINNTGWSTCKDLFHQPQNFTGVSGSCHPDSIDRMDSRPMWGTMQPPRREAFLDVFPDVCCWPGVTCCEFPTCESEVDNPITCNCTPGLVVALSLVANNMRGYLNGTDERYSIFDALSWLSCSLRGLQFQNNQLSGPLPSGITTLSQLQQLGLGYNAINGTIPPYIGQMTSLRVLELTSNSLSGTIPADLCGDPDHEVFSPLTDILLANNRLVGTLNITKCIDSIVVDVSNNQLTGIVARLPFFPQLHAIQLQHNRLQSSKMALETGRARVMTELNLGTNLLNGTVPAILSTQLYITSLILEHNMYSGNLSSNFFDNLGALSNLDLSHNLISGSLPTGLGKASSLNRLDLSNNLLTGVLPDSLVRFMSVNNSYLDIRSTFLSCCGSNFTLFPNGTGRYATMNYSVPRLPNGLAFSSILQPVEPNTMHQDNGSNLNCPFLKPPNVTDRQLGADQSGPDLLVTWFFDPAFTLYEGCQCNPGSILVNDTSRRTVYCVLAPPASSDSSLTWVWILVAVSGSALLLALVLWFMFFRGTRPILVQNWLDMRKRLKGAPQGGMVSIVVTDIEGFSDLMKESPELTTIALLIHNNIIRKAMWTNFGTIIEQEGDSFSIAFHEAQDAVRFCLQTQLLLAQQSWPPGLFNAKQLEVRESPGPSPRQLAGSTSKPHKGTFVKRVRQGRSQLSTKTFPRFSTTLGSSELSAKLEGEPQARPSRSATASVTAEPSPVNGLRVRMGIATGDVPLHSVLASSPVMELAKLVSDAGSGGQTLMCSSTFQAVRTKAQELGCVDLNGINYSKLNSTKAKWLFWTRKQQQQEQATLLHMGQYLHCKRGDRIPVAVTPQHLQLNQLPEPRRWRRYDRPPTAAASEFQVASTAVSLSLPRRSMQLYQVLAPSQVSRGRFFGSKLSLKEEWVPLDVPYFSAPGALLAPLTSSDFVPSHLSLPLVTMVFCMVDGGKQYAARNRRDAQAVHAELVALMTGVLRQVPGGCIKGQEGDLKYVVVFDEPRAALSWCLAVQECAMYLDWPASALQQWPEERSTDSQLLFRGPRLKMGVCEGTPRSILPDYNGRADYLGDSINQAARFMDAAHGGQVLCMVELATRVLSAVSNSFVAANSAEAGSPQDPTSQPLGPELKLPARASASAPDMKEQQPSPGSLSPGPAPGGLSVKQLATWHESEGGADSESHAGSFWQQQWQAQVHTAARPPAIILQVDAPEPEPSVAIEVKSTPGPDEQPTCHCRSEVVAVHLGSFRFGASDEGISMAAVSQGALAGRRFPSDPPQGKARASQAMGVLTTAHVPSLDIVQLYSRRGSLLDRPVEGGPAARISSMLGLPRTTAGTRRLRSFVWKRSRTSHIKAPT